MMQNDWEAASTQAVNNCIDRRRIFEILDVRLDKPIALNNDLAAVRSAGLMPHGSTASSVLPAIDCLPSTDRRRRTIDHQSVQPVGLVTTLFDGFRALSTRAGFNGVFLEGKPLDRRGPHPARKLR
jgi:hypothetical protein